MDSVEEVARAVGAAPPSLDQTLRVSQAVFGPRPKQRAPVRPGPPGPGPRPGPMHPGPGAQRPGF